MLTIFLIGLGLSMDAFSLSLAYGMIEMDKKKIVILPLLVGLFHFIMPLLGSHLGEIIISFIKVTPDLITFLILFLVGINLINESKKEKEKNICLTNLDLFLFAFAVSLDSFSVGIGLEMITSKHLESSLIFCILSMLFTFLGLLIGKKTKEIIGKSSIILGGILLILISLKYIF